MCSWRFLVLTFADYFFTIEDIIDNEDVRKDF